MTVPLQLVLHVLLTAERPVHGQYIVDTTRLQSGTVYPILQRLDGAGWLQAEWEDIDPAVAGRPRRRYLQLTTGGRAAAEGALERVPNVGLLREPR